MIKILTSEQVRQADQFTIKNEPIASIDLMERAAESFVNKFLEFFPKKRLVRIFCGSGNNGGDGLAIGRILKSKGWEVFKYVVGDPKKGSEDFKQNLDRSDLYAIIKGVKDLPQIEDDEIIIDGLFGSGLSRPLEGIFRDVVNNLNEANADKVAIDIPSGLFANDAVSQGSAVFIAELTISFQTPKLAFLLPENHQYVGEWIVVDIGLDKDFIQKLPSNYYLTESSDLEGLIPVRQKFTHKNQSGNLLMVAGSKGKVGAAVLSTKAAFAVGARLLNVCIPGCGVDIIHLSIPEAMVIEDPSPEIVTSIPKSEDTIAIGPGLGVAPQTTKALESLLRRSSQPIVIDADGLNILAKRKSLLKQIPKDSILTPHPGEFRRLVDEWSNDFEKLDKLREFAKKHQVNVVLKGANSAVCNTKGEIFFNTTGNPGLATAGSGDVLTGAISSLISQGIDPFEATKLGVYVHGLAGDLAVNALKKPFLLASEIIDFLPAALDEIS